MTASWSRVRELFERAFAVAPGERADLLDDACGGDGELRREVEELLEAATESAGMLEPPAVPQPAAEPATPGTEVGGYRLLRVAARGGMGVVYEAEQRQPRRRVALKMLSFGFASGTAARRFRDEAEILARLHHPNIAAVHAAGVHVDAEGREHPWFAMEFVEGATTLVEFAEHRRLSVAERLRLFAAVCDAIHHGHQRSVIHRDVKADNVLVGADGIPKVIDFGVARITDADAQRRTAASLESEVVGTLQAMSPEQLAGEPADTRADVYGLGVLLYHLLTGELPYDLGDKRLPQAIRLVREQPPRPPSTCRRPVGGDLEQIVLKAIAKDPDQRYAAAAALADDVRRYLRHEPVEARPPSLPYQLRKLARRHRVTVGASLLVFAAAVVATVISARSAVRATRAESSLRQQLERVARAEREAKLQGDHASRLFEDLLDLSVTLVNDFGERLGNQFGSLELRRDMTAKGVAILESLAESSAGDRRVLLAIARAHLGLAGVAGDQWRRNLGDAETAAESFRRAHEIAMALHSERPADREAQLLLATTTFHLASVDASEGRRAAAAAKLRTSIELRREVEAAGSLSGRELFGIAECHNQLFVLCMAQRDLVGARAELEAGRRVMTRLVETEPGERRWRLELVMLDTRQAALMAQTGAREEALPFFVASMRGLERLLSEADPPSRDQLRYLQASTQSLYAVTLREAGRLDDAQREMEQALVRFEAMIEAEPEALNQRQKRFGCLAELGHVARDRARALPDTAPDRSVYYDRARELYRQALAARAELGDTAAGPGESRVLAELRNSLAECEAAVDGR